MKKLMVEMLIIIVFVALFGGWALQEWRKRHTRLVGYIDEIRISKNAKYTHNFNTVKVYRGKWHNSYLEVGIDTITSEPVFKESVDSIKAKIGTMYGTDTPMEVIK